MTRIYHQTKELIIMEKPEQVPTEKIQLSIMRVLGGGLETIYEAHEIWFYKSHYQRFEFYKSKNYFTPELKIFLASKGINISRIAAFAGGKPSVFHFADDKDLFLFKLQFGA